TPIWVLVARIFQITLSFIVVCASGWFIHGLYLNELGFAIVCGLFTWIISLYTILTEKIRACQRGYNTWAVLSLEGLMIIFWLATMGAVASARAAFKYNVNATCTSDGSAVNSGHCTISKRVTGVASPEALGVVSGVAGLCAIIMLLFVASFAYVCHFFRLSLASPTADPGKHIGGATSVQFNPTPGAAMQPLMNQDQQQLYNHEQPRWAENQVYVQQMIYPQQTQVYDP
ncbi:uncharacterized protein BCR38DRAFT_328861, partial [Pseudomassariella vexata]